MARYVIFDGNIPILFPEDFPVVDVIRGLIERGIGEEVTSGGVCWTDSKWFVTRTDIVMRAEGINPKDNDRAILNRRLNLF